MTTEVKWDPLIEGLICLKHLIEVVTKIGMEMESSSSSSSSNEKWIHEVFLSFRGQHTRTTIISHLFNAFKNARINVFKDDQKLKRGKSIAPELLKAIRQSKYFVVVLSRNYADSSWCLNELTEIMSRCRRTDKGCNVYPVFFHVDPSDVQKQEGEFGKAFAKHEQHNFIGIWRAALTDIVNLAEFTLGNSEEADVVIKIVKEISKKLRDSYSSTFEIGHGLVGIDERLDEFKEKLRLDSPKDGARFIGICGMRGIGKSTLARMAYDTFSTHFDGKSYLSNVRGGRNVCRSMDLSNNLLSGNIPHELVALNFLAVISVVGNNLSGEVPTVGQFGGFTESSYEGNPRLCGTQLRRSCKADASTVSTAIDHEEDDDGFMDMTAFYASLASTYLVYILGFVVVLVINPYWRQVFYHIENMISG